MNFLFWNIQKKSSFFSDIVALVKTNEIDVLALAEFPLKDSSDKSSLLSLLKCYDNGFECMPQSLKKPKTVVFSRIPYEKFYIKAEGKIEAYETTDGKNKISIIFFHGPSILGSSERDQSGRAQRYNERLSDYETKYAKHTNTLICGDFNMNPFDDGLINARGFNSTMNITLAHKKYRCVEGKQYPFFYNPMWNLFANRGYEIASGTFYFDKPNYDNLFWKMLDQVMFRDSVIPFFVMKQLSIITSIGSNSLITADGRVDKNNYSDHLPIKFKLKI